MNQHWIESIRSEFLTDFFLLFPFLASSFFYITFISVGYWLKPGGRTFHHLGFLIPFATLTCVVLKNLFHIARPSVSLHLVQVESVYGFPSADVLVATVFWAMIYFRTQSALLKYLSVLVIALIGLSRIYLGVHSVSDVVGGAFFGTALVVVWRTTYIQGIADSWLRCKALSYWSILALLSGAFFITNEDGIFVPQAAMSIGALIGYGLSFRAIWRWQEIIGIHSNAHYIAIALCYSMVLVIAQVIPLVEYNDYTLFLSGTLEMATIIFLIFAVFPKIIIRVIRADKGRRMLQKKEK